jgi:hypothetical protein
LVERETLNLQVEGSNPSSPTNFFIVRPEEKGNTLYLRHG